MGRGRRGVKSWRIRWKGLRGRRAFGGEMSRWRERRKMLSRRRRARGLGRGLGARLDGDWYGCCGPGIKCNVPSSVAKRMVASELVSEMDMVLNARRYAQLVNKSE